MVSDRNYEDLDLTPAVWSMIDYGTKGGNPNTADTRTESDSPAVSRANDDLCTKSVMANAPDMYLQLQWALRNVGARKKELAEEYWIGL